MPLDFYTAANTTAATTVTYDWKYTTGTTTGWRGWPVVAGYTPYEKTFDISEFHVEPPKKHAEDNRDIDIETWREIAGA